MIGKKAILLGLCAVASMVVGCCDDENNRLKAANVSLTERLETCKGEVERLRAERDDCMNRMKAGLATGDAKDQEIARLMGKNQELEESNRVLKDGFVNLKKMYDELANAPRPMGPRLPEQLNTALAQFAAANPDLAEFDPKLGMVKLKSDLTFASGSDEVKSGASSALAKLVQVLNGSGATEFAVYVAGHTDDVPIGNPATMRRHPTNWYLSVHRAVGVEKELTKAGLDPKRIAVMGFGEYHPVAPNAPGKKGNAANRRVEIWIVPAGQLLSTPQ